MFVLVREFHCKSVCFGLHTNEIRIFNALLVCISEIDPSFLRSNCVNTRQETKMVNSRYGPQLGEFISQT